MQAPTCESSTLKRVGKNAIKTETECNRNDAPGGHARRWCCQTWTAVPHYIFHIAGRNAERKLDHNYYSLRTALLLLLILQQGATWSSGPTVKLRHLFPAAANVGRPSDFTNGPHWSREQAKALGQEAVARMAHLAVDGREHGDGFCARCCRFPCRSFTLPAKVVAIFA